MLQLIGLLAISWLLVWLFSKSNLSVLGLMPTKKRLIPAVQLFLLTAICCSTAFLFRHWLAKEQYMLNPKLSFGLAVTGIWETVRGVLTEELICRGVLLYILVKKLGHNRAILISSVLFALLHWLNNGVWGNALQMGIVFGFTFLMGLLLAFSYTRTFSILIPFAIHLGWNLVQNFVFPGGPAQQPLFVLSAPTPEVTITYTAFLVMLLFPKITAIGLGYWAVRRQPQTTMPR